MLQKKSCRTIISFPLMAHTLEHRQGKQKPCEAVKEEGEGAGVAFLRDEEEEEVDVDEEEVEAASEAEAAAGEADGKEAVAVVGGGGALVGVEKEASAWSGLRGASGGRAVTRLPKVSAWGGLLNGGREGGAEVGAVGLEDRWKGGCGCPPGAQQERRTWCQ